MEKHFARATALAVLVTCLGLSGGCALDSQTAAANDPSQVEQAAPVAHGETTVSYGHGVGN